MGGKVKYKPQKLDTVSFVQLDLEKGLSKKVSETSLPVAHEVEDIKKTLIGEKEDHFPTFKGIKNDLKRRWNKEKKSDYRAAMKFKHAVMTHFNSTRHKFNHSYNPFRSSHKNAAVSFNLSYNYMLLFCIIFLFIR